MADSPSNTAFTINTGLLAVSNLIMACFSCLLVFQLLINRIRVLSDKQIPKVGHKNGNWFFIEN